MTDDVDALKRAREIVEAFPNYAFNREHTEVLAKEVAAAIARLTQERDEWKDQYSQAHNEVAAIVRERDAAAERMRERARRRKANRAR